MPKVSGNGSIVQMEPNKPKSKCRKWRLRVSAGRDHSTGKYITFTRVVHGTYTEAKALLRDFIIEIETDRVIRNRLHDQTISEYSEIWIDELKREVAEGTSSKRENHLKCINRHIGFAYPHQIGKADIADMFEKLSAGDSPSGKKLSGTYLNDIAVTANMLFKSMVGDKLIAFNPVELVKRPQVDTEEKKALSYERIKELISKLDPTNPIQLGIRIDIKQGIRRGEAHALSWRDIDFDENVIYIRHNYDDAGNLKETKNKKSRCIPMHGSVREDLEKMLDAQIEMFEKVREETGASAPCVSSDTPIICNELGERIKPHSSTRWFERNRSRLGFAGWTIHETRHSYRTLLRKNKVPTEIAQRLLGHSSKAMSDLYDHIDIDEMRKETAKLDL